MKKYALIFAFLATVLISSGQLIWPQQSPEMGKFVQEETPFEITKELEADGKFVFGRIKVPQRAQVQSGPAFKLAVGIFKSRGEVTKDPLVLCAGGPGLSYLDDFVPGFTGELGNLFLEDRDVVIIESRGLKYSEPYLYIPEVENLQLSLLDQNKEVDETIDLYAEVLEKAYDGFTAQGYDLSAMNPEEMTHEIAYVMTQLGYDTFSMFGSSYGTVLVQYMLLYHPDRLSSAALNGTVNIYRSAYDMHVGMTDALEQAFQAVEEDPELLSSYPNLKTRFLGKISSLNKTPDTLNLNYGPNDREYKVVLNGNRVALWLFHQLYFNTQLPRSLSKICEGNYEEIEQNPGLIFPIPEFSSGLSLSVFLSGTYDVKPRHWLEGSEYEELIKGASLSLFGPYFYREAIKAWPVAPGVDPDEIRTETPLLLMGGKFDHLCKPSYATTLAKGQKNSYLYLFDNVVHSPVDSGPCAIMMFKEFLDDPSQAPASDCMQSFKHEYALP